MSKYDYNGHAVDQVFTIQSEDKIAAARLALIARGNQNTVDPEEFIDPLKAFVAQVTLIVDGNIREATGEAEIAALQKLRVELFGAEYVPLHHTDNVIVDNVTIDKE